MRYYMEDIFRAKCSDNYDIPNCPICGGKMYIEKLTDCRVAHFCKDGTRRLVKTGYCDTPEEVIKKFIDGEFIVKE